MPDRQIVIRQIDPEDNLRGLSAGAPEFLPLKTFLQKHAKVYEAQNLARTYGAFDAVKIVAYVALVCGEIVLEGDATLLDEPDLIYNYKSYPAVKIARLLVDSRYRGSGIGVELVRLCLGIAKDTICPAVGCRFVIVDSKKDSVGFYSKQGFTMLDTPENRDRNEPIMFVDIHKAG